MARLAAYYQEDFHYPVVGRKHKQRKSSYVFYDEPKNNVFNSHTFNRGRMRGLATSEPSLDLPQRMPEVLNQRIYQNHAQVYQNRDHFYQNHPYQYEDVSNMTDGHFEGYEHFDNESVFYGDLPPHDNRRHQRSRSRSRKRFSYAEPDGPEMRYLPQNVDMRYANHQLQNADFHFHDRKYHQPDNYYVEQCTNSPVYLRPESRQGSWQRHPFIHTNAHPVFLSPPSPLDSGLSSQSIGSSPSLDADAGFEHVAAMRSGRHSACSCARVPYYEDRGLNNHDYGRTSPGVYSVSHRTGALHPRYKDSTRKYSYDNMPQNCASQVRYGKLGLVGEPTDNGNKTDPSDSNRAKHLTEQQECNPTEQYVYTDDSDVPQRKATHRRKKSPASKFTRPCIIVIDDAEKNNRPPSSSPDREELSDNKSQGPESPMSITVSNSDSSEQEEPRPAEAAQRKSSLDKTTESEIRELEVMYARCNLGDRDLLDRAERRDLPTVHQQVRHRLPRSLSSDALCDTLRHNPYEPLIRAPPLRRSGMPDRVADDMALRKLQRPHSSASRRQLDNTVTYMLYSAHFTPSVPPAGKDFLLMGNPDVELDDLCYRKHYLGKEAKQDPQPPFGIPLRPPPTQKVSISDYLHLVPSAAPQPLCHPRGNPDVVRDDMAFRTLRKDEPDREYFDMSQIYRRKKKARDST